MPNTVAAFVCATALWVMFAVAASYDLVKRAAGEPWVVTASEKMPSTRFRGELIHDSS
jgi:hypothetical protein